MNHPLADRRLAWAQALTAEGDYAAAADLLDQVVALVPDWAPAWAALAEAQERAGDRAKAGIAWARAAELDPGGRLGAGWRLSALQDRVPAEMPDDYLGALFDDYAPRFERHLTEALHYRGPQLVLAALGAARASSKFGAALDLGCGTGLMGRALDGRVEALDGVDLSPKMIAAARRTGLYRELCVASLGAALASIEGGRYDLVTAADVLVYVGDLAPVFGSVARVLAAGGLFAFTLQLRLPLADQGHETRRAPGATLFTLESDLRFAHSRPYVDDEIAVAGLQLVSISEESARAEKGVAVPGLVVVARRT